MHFIWFHVKQINQSCDVANGIIDCNKMHPKFLKRKEKKKMSTDKIVAEFISRIDIFSISSKIAIRGPFTYMAQLQSQHG